MKRIAKYLFQSLLIAPALIVIFHSNVNGNVPGGGFYKLNDWKGINDTIVDDTTKLQYPFEDYKDPYSKRDQNSPLYLKNPSNVQTQVEYDPATGEYVIKEKVGDIDVRPSSTMSSEEFKNFTKKNSISDYWVEQRKGNNQGSANDNFLQKYLNPKLNVNIKGFDKIFGSNVIDIKPQGSAELIFGVNISKIENPTLPINLQRSTTFDFDMKIQMGVTGKIGEKMQVGINYNTEAQFDFENQTTITYTGDEDEIIQSIEAGNVSLPLTGTLITGSQSLFGLKTALQFGKLRVTSIFSQQKSESSTITVEGGAQTKDYEINVTEYESNKHFFLGHYFKDNYDRALQNLPVIASGINITRIEVWVTNKTGNFENSRNIIGFMDLAEGNPANIFRNGFVNAGSLIYPSNDANDLYNKMSTTYSGIRNINQISNTLAGIPNFEPIIDYAKIENARLLSPNEYTIHPKLGYISLNSPLNDDEVLAVAYEYTVGGRTYKVGEFSNGGITAPSTLILKLIKGPSLQPYVPTWNLMMKNVYSIGSYQINSEDFRLNVLYNDDETGTTVNYIDAGGIKGTPLLKVMNLDQLNSQLDPQPDGYFDFIDKLTINASNGRIFFPVREPFGEYLRNKISDETVADKYVFEELYDSTQSKAKQLAEKSKFILKGSYKSAGGSDISLNAFNIPEGSVKVSANGQELVEGTQYLVDYNLGRVTILDQSLLASGTPIKISLENNSLFNINRRTLLGTHLDYVISENFALGGTILHLSEKPLTNKVNIGSEPISNTIWGIDGRYSTDAPFLTRLIDGLPFVETKENSTIEVSGEFAHLIPGHSKTIGKNGNAYIDDFEGAKTSIDLKAQYEWALASTPKGQDLFPEGNTDSLSNGFNRAKLAWYNVNTDLLRNTSATPPNVSVDDQSNHFVREVPEKEIFPFKESVTGYPTILNIFNIVFYPNEKGPYNYDVDPTNYSSGVNPDGTLADPQTRWGGIMRDLQTNDFEAANIEYIEFWMMDPFVYEPNHSGGDLYFNLGYISEDILKDGRKSFENGLPTTSAVDLVDTTRWGRVPLQQSLVPAFDNNPTSRTFQDIGFDGLSDTEEASFFRDYLTRIQSVVTDPNARAKILQDPSGDNYHFFRGSDYDQIPNFSIMDRYKDFNGPDGNSPTASQSPESYPTSATLMPDVEDINQDNTLNEEETYFQYHIRLNPNNMENVGENFITDVIESPVTLKNKEVTKVKWYQFKIPVKEWESKHGPISDFRSIRFVRMFMHGFTDTIVTRFAKLDLVRSEWRGYEGSIPEGAEGIGNPQPPAIEGFDISVVSIEENGSRTPVNYVLPPGISRVTDPTNPYLVQLNEQSIQYKVTDLSDGDARAAYKNLNLDIRQYGKLQMEVHGEEIEPNTLKDYELTVFLRIGSDYKENFYEVEIPLKLTEHGPYNNESDNDRRRVWPEENRFDFELDLLQLVKQHRNNKMREVGTNTTLSSFYSEAVRDNMIISVVGNPNLSNVKTVMLGVRNPDQRRDYNFQVDDGLAKSGIIWFNELRLTDFREKGGWAANGLVKTKLADLGNVTVSASKSTHGFGSLDSKIEDRQKEDIFQYDVSSNMELGKFFPSKYRIRIPVYFGFSENIQTPEYNPLDPDILMKATLNDPEISAEEKDSIRKIVIDYTRRKSFNVTNLKIEGDPDRLKGKKKRFYHISNFSTSFAYNELNSRNIKTEYNIQRNYAGSFSYVFNNRPKALEPFKKVKFLNKKSFRLIKDMNFYLGPTLVSFRTDMVRKYQQSLVRDITLENSIIEPTYKKDFTWNRNYDLKYNLTKGLKFEYSATNKARIDEKEGIMDKSSPEYQEMRDTIWENILRGGRNINYNHSINASYTIPIDKLPLLGWTSATARYKATFDWTASPQLDTIQLGNTLSNSNTINLSSSLNFSKIYNKVPFLKNISDKMKRGANANKKYKDVKFVKENVRLKEGVGKSIVHNLQTEDVQIKVTDESGKEVEGELVVVNNKKVKFRAKGNVDNANIEVTGKKEVKQNFLKSIGEGIVNITIGLKNVSLSYSETSGTLLPGYLPKTRYSGLDEYTDESTEVSRWAPGVPFALGWQDENFGYKAYNQYGWVSKHPLQTSPYQMTYTQNVSAKASLEPLKGLKIDLSVNRTISRNRNEYDLGNPNEKYFTGNFSMSYLMWNTAFWTFGANYSSEAFEKFKDYRETIAWRLAQERNQARLVASPDYDINQPNIDPETGNPVVGYPNGYGSTSQEVMIPAFLAAYSGREPDKVELSTFPKFPLPNWRITYDGLSEVDLVKRIIKNINLSHSYNATYNVGSYETNADYNWYDVAYDGYSWARDEIKGLFIPEQQINSITLTETFNPLIGADVTWINNLSSKFEYNKGRTMTLNFSNNQVIDLINKEIIIGLGYRFDQLPIIIKTGKGQQKFQSDLNLRGDLSIMDQLSILRKVEEEVDQIQGGQKAMSLKLSADYALNERFNLRLFYDHAINTPRLSTSYRTSNIKFGISVRFTLIP